MERGEQKRDGKGWKGRGMGGAMYGILAKMGEEGREMGRGGEREVGVEWKWGTKREN